MLLGTVCVLVGLFCLTVFFGPPYLPTMHAQAYTALNLLELKPGQTLLELGSGDGRVARAAAARGLYVIGIEINPILVLIARLVTWRYRKRVQILWGSYWQTAWPEADGIFTFMIARQMAKLNEHVESWHKKPIRLASFAFAIPGKPPAKELNGIFLYTYK